MTIVLTDDVKALLDEVSSIAMARKIVLSQEAKECVDVPPCVIVVKDDDTLVGAECDLSLGGSVVQQVKTIVRNIYSHPELRRFQYVVSIVDSFVRYYDGSEYERVKGQRLADGALAKEFSDDPLTDVVEGFCVTVFDATGDVTGGVLEAFVEYKRDDRGMPFATNKVSVSDSVKSGQSSEVFDVMAEFVMMCRLSPDDVPSDGIHYLDADGNRIIDADES